MAIRVINLLFCSDTENAVEASVSFIPSVEVMVKALVLISSAAVVAAPETCGHIIFCSHHPALLGTGKRDGIWQVTLLALLVTSYIKLLWTHVYFRFFLSLYLSLSLSLSYV